MPKEKAVVSENDVKKLALNWFKEHRGWSFAPVSRGMGVHGIPDRVGCVPVTITPAMVGQTIGLFVGLEAKRPGRRREEKAGVSGLQVVQMDGIINAGGIAYVVDSQDDLFHLTGFVSSVMAGSLSLMYGFKELFLKRINKNG